MNTDPGDGKSFASKHEISIKGKKSSKLSKKLSYASITSRVSDLLYVILIDLYY